MQFSPNIYLRYSSALRIYMQKRICKKGVDKKTPLLLKNILLFEMIFCEKGFYETNLFYFFDRLSCALTAERLKRSKWTDITVTGVANGKINRNALIYILCQCFDAKNININIKDGSIAVITDLVMVTPALKNVIQTLKGVILKETDKNKYGIFIPFKRCKNPVLKSPDEYDYLLNPISVLKVFLPQE